ncbi:ATP-binding protein [Luteibacter sp. 9133]|uniref:AAA family ATPase n=1 Tax=Luteibacter sp. 9133 TaxID=1500891 RepID=UPI00068B29C7|nr:ATP-binding protein [Luteibacter sp. 9133]
MGTVFDEGALVNLVAGAMAADYTAVRRAGVALAVSLESQSPELARKIRSLVNRKGVQLRASGIAEALPVDAKSRQPLVEEQPTPVVPLFVSDHLGAQFRSFLDDARSHDRLAAAGIASRLSLLLSGPPGTGKSLLAGHVAAHLGRPLYVVRLDSVISSLLGDTAKNIRNIFDSIPARGVLFLDEIDAIAKLRDDRHELGELKRVVNTLLQGLDSLDDSAVVIGATNHAQLLDPAVWRRFPYTMDMGMPDVRVREDIWTHFLAVSNDVEGVPKALAAMSDGLTGADIQMLSFAARRKSVLSSQKIDFVALASSILAARGLQVDARSEGDLRAAIVRLALHDGATQSDVAKMFGVTRQAISAHLKGEKGGGKGTKRERTANP